MQDLELRLQMSSAKIQRLPNAFDFGDQRASPLGFKESDEIDIDMPLQGQVAPGGSTAI